MSDTVTNPYIAREIERTKQLFYAACVLAYLSDISGACEAVGRFLDGVDYAAYHEAELTRSSVERQLILIGEAVNSLLRLLR